MTEEAKQPPDEPQAEENIEPEVQEKPKEPIIRRQSRWQSSLEALSYVSNLAIDDDVQIRDSDRATSIALLVAWIVTVISLILPALTSFRLGLITLCDLLVAASLIFYCANRLGIVNTLNPRQALLSWQLILCSLLVGFFLAVNLAVIIALVVASSPLEVR